MGKEYTETQLKAKELGVKGWHVKGDDKLMAEMTKVQDAKETVDPVSTEKVVAPKKEDPMVLVKLMAGLKWDQAMISLKCLGSKSPFYSYSDTIIKESEIERAEEKEAKMKRLSVKNGN